MIIFIISLITSIAFMIFYFKLLKDIKYLFSLCKNAKGVEAIPGPLESIKYIDDHAGDEGLEPLDGYVFPIVNLDNVLPHYGGFSDHCPMCTCHISTKTTLIETPVLHMEHHCMNSSTHIGCGYKWTSDVNDSSAYSKVINRSHNVMMKELSSLREENEDLKSKVRILETPILIESDTYREPAKEMVNKVYLEHSKLESKFNA